MTSQKDESHATQTPFPGTPIFTPIPPCQRWQDPYQGRRKADRLDWIVKYILSSITSTVSNLPDLRQLILLPPIEEAYRRPVRLYFDSIRIPGTAPSSPFLRCITGSFDDSDLSIRIMPTLRPAYQQSFSIHIDSASLAGSFDDFWAGLPLPYDFRHLVITFPALDHTPIMKRGVYPDKTVRQDWLRWIVEKIKALDMEAVVLEVLGGWTVWQAKGRKPLIGNKDDGLWRTESIDLGMTTAQDRFDPSILCAATDQNWKVLGQPLERDGALRKVIASTEGTPFPSLNAAIRARTRRPGEGVTAPVLTRGTVSIVFSKSAVSACCPACGIPYATTKPFSPMSTIPKTSRPRVVRENTTAFY